MTGGERLPLRGRDVSDDGEGRLPRYEFPEQCRRFPEKRAPMKILPFT